MASHALANGTNGGARVWLHRIYEYIGAHNHALRAENEIERARLRTILPLAATAWICVYHRVVETPLADRELVWIVAALTYGLASLFFWTTLLRCPAAGLHAQYTFLACDPLMIGWAIYAAPEPSAWFMVMLLIVVLRTGFRYGLRAMKVEIGFSWLGAALPLLFSPFWHQQYQMTVSLLVLLACSWWLFVPLICAVEKVKRLETERRIENAKNESLLDSLEARSQFLSRVSHELRSPLQRVVSALDLAGRSFAAADAAEAEHLSQARRGTIALDRQLRDLLTLARGEVGKMEMDPLPFELTELVTCAGREVQPEADAKGLVLEIVVPPEPMYVVADSGRIDQVVAHLLTNAISQTHSGAVRLTLHAYDPENHRVRFTVADSGPGVAPDRLPSLFTPYRRRGTISIDGEGAGVDLAVVHMVLRFLGGSAVPKSALGVGTTFEVQIPAPRIDGDQGPEDSTQNRRILVVNHLSGELAAITSLLTHLGFECDTATSAATAANLLGFRSYDTALIDLDMPIKGGFDLACDTRRSKGPNNNIRLLSISASDLPASGASWPFDGHLTKPVTMRSIQRTLGPPARASSAPKR